MRKTGLVLMGALLATIVFKHDFQAYSDTAVTETKARIWSQMTADRG